MKTNNAMILLVNPKLKAYFYKLMERRDLHPHAEIRKFMEKTIEKVNAKKDQGLLRTSKSVTKKIISDITIELQIASQSAVSEKMFFVVDEDLKKQYLTALIRANTNPLNHLRKFMFKYIKVNDFYRTSFNGQ